MSNGNKSETERLLIKLDEMAKVLKVDDGPIDYKSIKDKFDKIRFEINQQLKDCETFLEERDKLMLSNIPKEIMQRKIMEQKAENILSSVSNKLKNLDMELTAQKKKKENNNIESKKEIVKLLNERYSLLRNRFDGLPIQEKEIEDNRTNMEKLDELLKQREGRDNVPERELYQEEKDKMEEWKKEVNQQNIELEEIHHGVKEIKNQAKLAGEAIKNVGAKVKSLDKHTDKTGAALDSQNKKLKDLLNKIRTSDRFCVDLILFLILLGLIAVLYCIIKNKF